MTGEGRARLPLASDVLIPNPFAVLPQEASCWKINALLVIKQIYIYFLSFPPKLEPAQTGQRAGFQAAKMVSGEVWNFPADTAWQKRGRVPWEPGQGAASTPGLFGKWSYLSG